jgi:hypothetical protein
MVPKEDRRVRAEMVSAKRSYPVVLKKRGIRFKEDQIYYIHYKLRGNTKKTSRLVGVMFAGFDGINLRFVTTRGHEIEIKPEHMINAM